jgi:hypothetical protein
MLLFLLTAREGRVSANHLDRSVIAQTRRVASFVLVQRRRIRVSRAIALRHS